MTTTPTRRKNSAVPSPPPESPRPPTSQIFSPDDLGNNSNDNVSTLTDYTDTSVVSRIGDVFAQAKLILQGQSPNTIWEEEDEDGDVGMNVIDLNGEDSNFNGNHTNNNNNNNSSHLYPSGTFTNHRDTSGTSNQTIDFLQDKHSEMTRARRIALRLMKTKAWYNPQLNKKVDDAPNDEVRGDSMELNLAILNSQRNIESNNITVEAYPFSHSRRETPSLEKAWAYFEHVALPRYVVDPKDKNKRNVFVRCCRRLFCKGNQQLQRAEPGEHHMPTRLYRPIFTPHSQLGDWGLGVGLYFSTLRAICVLTFLAGCLNILNIQYFASDDYSGDQPGLQSFLMRGSAICTKTEWVPCSDCNKEDNLLLIAKRVGTTGNSPDDSQKFARRNLCNGVTIEQGMTNWATLILVLLGIYAINLYLKRMEVHYDEDEQTAQDYSVMVTNPPPDATDPEEWRCYFRDNFNNAHVTTCTIAVENDLLVRSLVERREILRKIEMIIEPGTSLDQLTLAGLAAKEESGRKVLGRWKAALFPGLPEHFSRLAVLTAKVQGLAQQDYPVTNVFITFERESDQRYVLKHLTTGIIPAQRGHTGNIAPHHLFRGHKVLHVMEPDEPNTIRWQDLNENWKDRLRQQGSTTFATIVAIVLIAFIVFLTNDASVTFSAYAIAIFNALFPMFAKYLTSLEAHSSDGGKQRSLYFKIALFRWVNTAVVITIITPHQKTLADGGLIKQVYALFFAEITTTNILQLLDLGGHFSRHFSAPRAKTQDAMNLSMQGQQYELAERYTNMTKLLFLALWYCSIYPGALFLCSFAIFINYFVDRFSLMRTWKRAPHLGPETSRFSRQYFFPLAVFAMALVSSYYWSGFPFDSVCAKNGTVLVEQLGSWELKGVKESPIEVTSSDTAYQYCLQDFFKYDPSEEPFPFLPQFQREGREWMSDDQEFVTTVFGWTTVAVLGALVLFLVYGVATSIYSMFYNTYTPRGKDQSVNFSDVPSISTYIPQVESAVFSYPLLACNVDKLDEELFDWNDPDRPKAFYDLTKDAQVLLRGIDKGQKKVRFSNITHWSITG